MPAAVKRGVIGRIGGRLGRIDSSRRTREADGFEPTGALEVTRVKRTPDGLDVTLGRATTQNVPGRSPSRCRTGKSRSRPRRRSARSTTEFLAAGEEFAVVDSGDGTFAFGLLGERFDADVSRAAVDLDAVRLALEDSPPWKVGSYGHDRPVENGAVHGEDVLEDGVFGRGRSPTCGRTNSASGSTSTAGRSSSASRSPATSNSTAPGTPRRPGSRRPSPTTPSRTPPERRSRGRAATGSAGVRSGRRPGRSTPRRASRGTARVPRGPGSDTPSPRTAGRTARRSPRAGGSTAWRRRRSA